MGSTSGRFNSGREDREGKKRKRERKKKEGYFCLFTAHLTASKQEMNISGKRLQIRNSVIQKADVPGLRQVAWKKFSQWQRIPLLSSFLTRRVSRIYQIFKCIFDELLHMAH